MLDPSLSLWLDTQAQALDQGLSHSQLVLSRLADADVLRVGISPLLGGSGGNIADAVEKISKVASHSLAAAFFFWGQRAFIEYVLQSPNAALREKLLPSLLDGKLAGATGLANAMKCLSEIETLQIRARPNDGGWILNGQLNWVTNLRKSGFVVATVVENEIDDTLFVMAVPCSSSGMHRSADLQLMGLQSSNTAALSFEKVNVGRDWLLHADARAFLPSVRPAFLGLQCGLAIGLARRALQEAESQLQNKRSMLFKTLLEQRSLLENSVSELKCGLLDGRFLSEPVALFRLRIDLAESASKAVQLELQASGGNAYLSDHGSGFARRWRESALIPIITPSLVQLCEELQRKGQEAAA